MPGYSDNFRTKVISQFQQQWQETGISVENFSVQAKVHHTTMRQWLRKYAPEFETKRKQLSKTTLSSRSEVMSENSQGVQIETEWYQKERQLEISEDYEDPVTSPQRSESDQIEQLLDEICFLKQQVVYWMRQEPV